MVTAEVSPQDFVIIEHYTARSGVKVLDDQRLVRKKLYWKFVLDEHQFTLYAKYFMGLTDPTNPSAPKVNVFSNPLFETNILVTYKNPAGNIWTFSHTRARARPTSSMNFAEFNNFVQFEVTIEILQDLTLIGPPDTSMGVFTFTSS